MFCTATRGRAATCVKALVMTGPAPPLPLVTNTPALRFSPMAMVSVFSNVQTPLEL